MLTRVTTSRFNPILYVKDTLTPVATVLAGVKLLKDVSNRLKSPTPPL